MQLFPDVVSYQVAVNLINQIPINVEYNLFQV